MPPARTLRRNGSCIAATGTCSSLRVSEQTFTGEDGSNYIAEVDFKFYTQRAIKFTDAPNHKSFVMKNGGGAQAADLASSDWDHKNIAMLTPVPRQNGDCANPVDLDWATAVYEVEGHSVCDDKEDGEDCVHYSGFVSSKTPNFPARRNGDFACQLFVDTTLASLAPASPPCSTSRESNYDYWSGMYAYEE